MQCMYVDQINKIYVAGLWAACGGKTRHGWEVHLSSRQFPKNDCWDCYRYASYYAAL